jgi:hypothetical protein
MRALTLALTLAACGHPGSSGPAQPGSGSDPGSGSAVTQTGSGGGTECDAKECGPKMGMPQKQCHDGTMGGPTGRCLKNEAGTCSWEVKACPE